ncbi:MAG: PAS domain-containing protein [Thalassobaculaceae bacterium]|nr:PAS domain-containing protein [Thalassobaculaceae bacterium]
MSDSQPLWRSPTDDEIVAAATAIAAGSRPADFDDSVLDVRFADSMDALPEATLQFLYDFWRSKAGNHAGLSRREDFEMLALLPAVGNIMILDVEREGFDARYRLYGTKIAQSAGKDWTGKTVSEMNASAKTNVALLYRATYLTVYRTNRPLYTEHSSLPWLGATAWRRLILPVTLEGTGCDQFIVGNVAVDAKVLSAAQIETHRRILQGKDSSTKS